MPEVTINSCALGKRVKRGPPCGGEGRRSYDLIPIDLLQDGNQLQCRCRGEVPPNLFSCSCLSSGPWSVSEKKDFGDVQASY
jgi:hypothetical protein